MKNKEINLSSASLDKKEDFEKKVLEEKEPNEEKKETKKGLKEKISDIKEKFQAWWKVAPKRTKILTIAIPAILLLGGSAFFFYYTVFGPRTTPPDLSQIDVRTPRVVEGNLKDFGFLTLANPSLPRTEESPINGRLFTREEMEELKERRPIAAIISNHIHARPTSNLHQADVVYETLVEGGITRIVAIYWSNEPNKIGPIRSARQYYLEWLSPYDPLFIYDGFAVSNDPRVNAAGNIIKYNLKKIYVAGAWRVSDRPAPHNEYSSTKKTWEIGEDRGWDGFPEIESWEFKNDAKVEDRVNSFKAKISFSNSENYNVIWDYDKSTNRYLRNIGGSPDRDLETNEQISAKNVVIKEVKVEGPVDEYNRLIITTTGSGTVAILQDGKVTYGTWEKEDRTSRMKFYDNSGKEISLNRGTTWVSAVRQIDTDFDIIEQ